MKWGETKSEDYCNGIAVLYGILILSSCIVLIHIFYFAVNSLRKGALPFYFLFYIFDIQICGADHTFLFKIYDAEYCKNNYFI